MNPFPDFLRPPGAFRPVTEAGQAFFGNPEAFPDVHNVANLVERGLQEKHVIAAVRRAGYELPMMLGTLADLGTVLPYLNRESDALAEQHGDDLVLFALRDGWIQGANFAITNPEVASRFIPASHELRESLYRESKEIQRQFLSQLGITREWVDQARQAVLVDTGFEGTVCDWLNTLIRIAYGRSLDDPQLVTPKMICSRVPEVQQIINFEPDEPPLILPRTRCWEERAGWWEADVKYHGSAFPLAAFLQTLPKPVGSYNRLVRVGQALQAMPGPDTRNASNIDSPIYVKMSDYRYPMATINASHVHPGAAAIVLYRVARSALEHAGRISKPRPSRLLNRLGMRALA